MSKHTPGPWSWQGEDYRANWGWQILVGPNGEGLIVGQGENGKPSEHLRANTPVEPELCITGMMAVDKPHVNAVHVFSEANARLIAAAPELLEALERAEAALWLVATSGNKDAVEIHAAACAAIAKAKGKTP